VGHDGDVRLADADGKRVLRRVRDAGEEVRGLAWSDDGKLLLVVGQSSVRVVRADGRLVGSVPTNGPTLAAAFQPRTHRFALVVGPMILLVDGGGLKFPPRATFTGTTQLSDVTWSPEGKWLAVAWPRAGQLVFVGVAATPKLYVVSNVARQFDPAAKLPRFPNVARWSR